MAIVMISGSRTRYGLLPNEAWQSIDKIIELDFEIIIGDCYGVDRLVQQYLKGKNYSKVIVYYALFDGNCKPRYHHGFKVVGIDGNYIDRDKAMCTIADYGLAIWDGKSKGTKANIERVAKTKVVLL